MSKAVQPSGVASGTIGFGADKYFCAGNANTSQSPLSTTEAYVAVTCRQPSVVSNLKWYIFSNTLNQPATLYYRVNGVDTGLSITIAASTAGEVEDVTNKIQIVSGDEVSLRFTEAATSGAINIGNIQTTIASEEGTVVRLINGYNNTITISTSGATHYVAISGCQVSAETTEADAQADIRTPGVLRNLWCYADINTFTATVTLVTRINGADGSQSISIPTLATGIFEDITNSDEIVSGDKINYATIAGVGTGSLFIPSYSVELATTNHQTFHCLANTPAYAIANGAVRHGSLSGHGGGGTLPSGLSAGAQVHTRTKMTYKGKVTGLTFYLVQNTITIATTVLIKKNTTDASIPVSVPASTAGAFVSTDEMTFNPGDYLHYTINAEDLEEIGSGTMSLGVISCVTENNERRRVIVSG